MPLTVRKALNNTHRYALRVLVFVMIFSVAIALLEQDHSGLPYGNLRLLFFLVVVYANYLLLERIDRRISAFVLLFTCYLSFFIYPLLPIETNYAESLFLLPSTMLVFCVLPYLVYDIKNEKVSIGGWVAVFLITFFFAVNKSIEMLDPDRYAGLIIIFTNYTMLGIAYFASWAFIQIMFFKYLKNIEGQGKHINEVNDNLKVTVNRIAHQNKDLDAQSEKLMSLQKQLSSLNDELESKVRERTAELERQLEAMNKYGFMNSALMQGPLDSIKKQANFKSGIHSLQWLQEF